jgi:hypothetical protein
MTFINHLIKNYEKSKSIINGCYRSRYAASLFRW